jgi:integrase
MRPGLVVHVYEVPKQLLESRKTLPSPWRVRWTVNGKVIEKNFRVREQAVSYWSDLTQAVKTEYDWDSDTGVPVSWGTDAKMTVAEWVRRDMATKKGAPRGLESTGKALLNLVERAVKRGATPLTKEDRAELHDWIAGARETLSPRMATWVKRYSLKLADLTKPVLETLKARLLERVPVKDKLTDEWVYGDLGHWAGHRNVIQARASLLRAVDAGLLYECKWPKPKDSERNLKSNQPDEDWEDRIILDVADAISVLDAMVNRTQVSYRMQCMTGLAFNCGMRPSEIAELAVADMTLPREGWGEVRVRRAHIGTSERYTDEDEEVGTPKTSRSRRVVPLPPVTVPLVRAWMEHSGITSGPLFHTAGGKAVASQNWCRSLAAACKKAGVERIVPYDARHYYASHASQRGMDQARLASLMGTSMDVLDRYFVHLTKGQEDRVREILELALGE